MLVALVEHTINQPTLYRIFGILLRLFVFEDERVHLQIQIKVISPYIRLITLKEYGMQGIQLSIQDALDCAIRIAIYPRAIPTYIYRYAPDVRLILLPNEFPRFTSENGAKLS